MSQIQPSMKLLFNKSENGADELQELTETINTMLVRIDESLRQQQNFFASASHELKTPLFTVQGYLLTLLDGAMNDKTIRKKYLQRAEKGVERLIYIVKDLDMITKLEAGDLNLEFTEFNIVDVVQNVFDLLEMRADQKNIMLMFDRKYPKAIKVFADKERIQQVVTNLVENSIKYGKENGTTEISIEDLVNNKVIIRVTDNGEGIQKQFISRLFERFFRGGNATVIQGTGLGLHLIDRYIRLLGGKVEIKSELNKGTELYIQLPLN